jgi:glycosyltransferase involved in cell wall biosynthesis
MKILIYNPYWNSFGGGEKYVTVLGEVLSRQGNEVVFLALGKHIAKEKLEQYFNADLSRVRFDCIAKFSAIESYSQKFDILFALTNFRAVPSQAKKTVFIIQAPYGKKTLNSVLRKLAAGNPRESAKDYFRIKLLKASKHIALVVVYSQFVQTALRLHHGIDSYVLTPPIDDFFIDGIKKKKIILSVGRIFAGVYNQKRYDITTKVFREISRKEIPDWEYHIVGSVADDIQSKKMLAQLQKENEQFPVFFHCNEPYIKLKEWYNRASIFWHAAGYDVAEEKFPEQTEHFGMSTVEAMSAFTVPVVINNGGQKEIVQHTKNGFLWTTTEELKQHTLFLVHNDVARNSIAQNCRDRYVLYDRNRFADDVKKMMLPIVEQK